MNKDKSLKAISYGEVLWDIFPDDTKIIGGAPLNVALRMKSLGCDATMISCVGNDADGKAILDYVKDKGLNTNGILVNNDFNTGTVIVHLDENRTASYNISYPSAWDKIEADATIKKMADTADVLIYGSLVCRDETSRTTLLQLLDNTAYKVFDVNLRKPYYSMPTIEMLMQKADFIKLNDEELPEITEALDFKCDSLEKNMQFIAQKTNTKAVCVTRSKDGALLLWNNTFYSNPGYTVKVADTVGAGDSFLASLITKLLTDTNPQEAIDFACAVGSLVASKPGANAEISNVEIQQIMK